ncbi:hypothetical protein V5R04_00260 [Jonesiaceae bacterium BS-20]|uniref:Uncharacterized protein n=1 Tax=Jonesiaceae bacterium BS-20 TaxID=3120821 RepID=A0AAU7DV42_9MICO
MSWPPLTINLDPEQGAELLLAGLDHKKIPPGANVRALAIQEAQAVAANYKRTIPVTCVEPGATFELSVAPDGTITDLTDPKVRKKQQPKNQEPVIEAPDQEPEILAADPPALEEDIPLVQVPDFYPNNFASLDQTVAPLDLDSQPLPPTIPANTINAVKAGGSEAEQDASKPTSTETAESQANEHFATTAPTDLVRSYNDLRQCLGESGLCPVVVSLVRSLRQMRLSW